MPGSIKDSFVGLGKIDDRPIDQWAKQFSIGLVKSPRQLDIGFQLPAGAIRLALVYLSLSVKCDDRECLSRGLGLFFPCDRSRLSASRLPVAVCRQCWKSANRLVATSSTSQGKAVSQKDASRFFWRSTATLKPEIRPLPDMLTILIVLKLERVNLLSDQNLCCFQPTNAPS